jgi:hypothetical protein
MINNNLTFCHPFGNREMPEIGVTQKGAIIMTVTKCRKNGWIYWNDVIRKLNHKSLPL